MDFGYIGQQLIFVTRSRDVLIGCMFGFFFFILLRAIHPLFDSRLLIDCQWFFETAGKSDRQSERGQKIAASRFSFIFLMNDGEK